MIVQLPNGRIVECSLDQYLSLTDQEVNDLNGLSTSYTKEVGDPFYDKFSGKPSIEDDPEVSDFIQEHEPRLYEIEDHEKMEDPYFHSDDV